MDIQAAEISAILKQQIEKFGIESEVAEIGQVLDVTESRVSQLRTRALKALREELATALAE